MAASSSGRKSGVPTDGIAWATLDSLDVGVLALSPELRVLYANARWDTWLGATVAEGTPFAMLVDEGVVSPTVALHATLADGEPRTLHFSLRAARADAFPRRVTCSARRAGWASCSRHAPRATTTVMRCMTWPGGSPRSPTW